MSKFAVFNDDEQPKQPDQSPPGMEHLKLDKMCLLGENFHFHGPVTLTNCTLIVQGGVTLNGKVNSLTNCVVNGNNGPAIIHGPAR